MRVIARLLGFVASVWLVLMGFLAYLDAANHVPQRHRFSPVAPAAAAPPGAAGNRKSGKTARTAVTRPSAPMPAPPDSPVYERMPRKGMFRFAWLGEEAPPVGPNGGRLDAFGNEWVAYVDRERGYVATWKVYLSTTGRLRWAPAIGGHPAVFVTADGRGWGLHPRLADTY